MLGKSGFADLSQRGTFVMFTAATPLQNNCAPESHLSATPQFLIRREHPYVDSAGRRLPRLGPSAQGRLEAQFEGVVPCEAFGRRDRSAVLRKATI